MPALKSLEPILTCTCDIYGILTAGGTSIDTAAYVKLAYGYVGDSNRSRLKSIKCVNGNSNELPFDSTLLIGFFNDLQTGYSGYFSDSTPARSDTLVLDSVHLKSLAQNIVSNSNITIRGSLIHKNVIASGSITLESQSDLRGCFIMANSITIAKGNTDYCRFFSPAKIIINEGSHNSQFFASDSIIIGERVTTGPLSLWISEITPQNTACIYFHKNKNIVGTAISFKTIRKIPYVISIYIEDSTIFKGYLITDNMIYMNNVDITGRIYAQAIQALYNSMLYTQGLIGVTLHLDKTPMVFPLLGPIPDQLFFIQSGKSVSCN